MIAAILGTLKAGSMPTSRSIPTPPTIGCG